MADRSPTRHKREPAIPQGHRAQMGVRIGDYAGQESREVKAPEERSQARCASTRRESVLLASLRQRRIHPETGGVEYPRQNSNLQPSGPQPQSCAGTSSDYHETAKGTPALYPALYPSLSG
jgi:hypothetical protein